MKKSIILIAAAALLSMTACQKDEPVVINPNSNASNTPANSTAKVKTTADLIGTEWEYTYDFSADIDSATLADMYSCMDSADVEALLSMTFGLNFDANYAHLTFPENTIGLNVVEIDSNNYTVEEIESMDYTYTYTLATLSGTLTDGNLGNLVIPFTYDATADAIIINLMSEEEDGTTTPWTLVFTRAI